jgi:tRNA(Ile)-lysidine synthase
MFDEFQKYVLKNRLFRTENRVLLAVSGGIDSMVMSHLFIKLGMRTGIAHCNFSLRGAESDKDEELVRKFAGKNKIPFYSVRFKTKEYSAEKGISVQMAARYLRYEWFEKIREENNYDLIAVGHNLNDNIETLIINLTRGTGLTGLAGMRPASDRVIRPLLFASRKRIEKYCVDNQIPYREDRSNVDTKYTRNKIRHKVLPVLMEINPSIEETLNETAERVAGADEILASYIDRIRREISSERDGITLFDVKKLLSLKPLKPYLFEIFAPFGITSGTTDDLVYLLTGQSGKKILTRSHRIIRNRKELLIYPLTGDRKENYIINSIEDLTSFTGIVSAGIITRPSDYNIPDNQNIACIDFDKIKFPLMIRRWKSGDLFYPLSDHFTDRKFSLVQKEQAMILESDSKIVWIIGERLDDRFRVTESTSRILRIESKNLTDL